MKKGFSNPSSSAKGCGILLIILALFPLLLTLFGSSFVPEVQATVITPFAMVEVLIALIAGYGLYNKKLYGIYSLGLLFLISVVILINNISQGFTLVESLSYTLIIYVVSFIWFWSGKKDFS